MTSIRIASCLLAGATLLSGCAQSQLHLSQDFGRAFHESTLAQIADPDARYEGLPAPGSNGSRVGLSQERYRTGKVIQPKPATTTTITSAVSGAGSEE